MFYSDLGKSDMLLQTICSARKRTIQFIKRSVNTKFSLLAGVLDLFRNCIYLNFSKIQQHTSAYYHQDDKHAISDKIMT